MLSAIELEKLKPSPDSLKQLGDNILKDAQGEEWLRISEINDDGCDLLCTGILAFDFELLIGGRLAAQVPPCWAYLPLMIQRDIAPY
jgi:hypothetical protein